MISSRWQKVINDLLMYKSRSFLVVAAIVAGVWGIGSVMTSYAILEKDIRLNFLGTNPQSATLWTNQSLDNIILEKIRALPGVAEAELRKKISARILVGQDHWLPLTLIVVEDFNDLRIGRFSLEQGRFPSTVNEMVIERDAFIFGLLNQQLRDEVTIKLPGIPRQKLKLSGQVFDPGQAPSHMEHLIYGYISSQLYEKLSGDVVKDELKIIVAENRFSKNVVKSTVQNLKAWLEANNVQVRRIYIPPPGEHPHQWQMDSLLFLQGAFGFLALLLSGILIINIINFLLARQVREIGMMKAIGASSVQVKNIYYMMVITLGLVAVMIAVPLSVASGKNYAAVVAAQLNFNIITTIIPIWVYIVLGVVGLLLPLVVSIFPIRRGTSITVREAMMDYGLSGDNAKPKTSRVLQYVRQKFSRLLQIAIGSAFRVKGRVVLTIATLALGTALFMVALNLRATLENTLDISSSAQRFDIGVIFKESYSKTELEPLLEDVDGLKHVEYWNGRMAPLIYQDGTQSNVYQLAAPPVSTDLINYPIITGRWLQTEGRNEVVINNAVQALEPELEVGDKMTLRINEQNVEFDLVGVVKEFGSMPRLFIPAMSYQSIVQEEDKLRSLFVVTHSHETTEQSKVLQQLETIFEQAGINVYFSQVKQEKFQVIKDHLNIITSMLLSASIMSLIVGSLGFISTLSINILERTREIGVMRAIGASHKILSRMFLAEAATIGILSWIMGLLVSVPLGYPISDFLGGLIFEVELDFSYSISGMVFSFVLILLLVLVASTVVGLESKKQTVQKAFAYG